MSEDIRSYFPTYDEWPPTDPAGNEYPLDFFEADDLGDDGQLTDSIGRQYSPFTGALQPIEGRCNAPLTRWEDRYPDIRFCTQKLPWNADSPYCHVHRPKENLMDSAQDALTSGLFTKTYDHLYDKLDPYKRIVAHGLWSSLMSESTYQFDTESRAETFDFSESEYGVPPEADADDTLTVTAEYPTERVDRALALWSAALDSVKALSVQSRLLDEDGGGVMATEQATEATLVGDDENGTYFRTLEEIGEHPLNLPYSRLIRDREDLLTYGGVTVESDEQTSGGPDEFILEVDASSDHAVDDPNQFDGTSKSREIVEAADESPSALEGEREFATPNDDAS